MERCSAVSDGSGPTTEPLQAPILLPDNRHLDSCKLLLLHTSCTDAMISKLPASASKPASQHLRLNRMHVQHVNTVLHLLGNVQRKVQTLCLQKNRACT